MDALLLTVTLAIYLIYFHPILFHLNSVLSGVTLDTLKNYYTYLYHTTDNGSWLTFQGMNYPFGEHLVYTDCQPLLCWLFRPLPFTHPYLIGILHFLMFFSYIITPNILLRILKRAGIPQWPAALFALGIALLSPQFLKIQAGHHSLSYACIIPLSILLLQKTLQGKKRSDLAWLFAFNTLIYFIHPYFGFSLNIFSFFAIFFCGSLSFRFIEMVPATGRAIAASLLPLLIFKLFMLATDHKADRPVEPIGVNFMIENLHSLLSPDFGPLKDITEKWLTKKPGHFEGHTYLGAAVILSTLFLVLTLLLMRRKPAIERTTLSIFLSALVLLMLAFGYHFDLMEAMGKTSNTFNQFRATCRFAWFFYYALPVFVLPLFFRSFQLSRVFQFAAALGFSGLSLYEANFLFKHDEAAYWHFDNFFREKFLTSEQKEIVSDIRSAHAQALVPLPIFHGGSEVYDRLGSNNSMTPAMLYSFHCRLPVLSVSLSRTSAHETEELIQSLNAYKKQRETSLLFSRRQDFLLLKTNDEMLPDEHRLLSKATPIHRYDSLALFSLSPAAFSRPYLDSAVTVLQGSTEVPGKCIFIKHAGRTPYLETSFSGTELVAEVDSMQLPAGPQVISLHLYYQSKHFKAVAGDLVIEKVTAHGNEWIKNIPLRILSGFYPGYAVFEYNINLPADSRYRFLIQGWQQNKYHISDFMLRSATNTIVLKSGQDTISINNFPLR